MGIFSMPLSAQLPITLPDIELGVVQPTDEDDHFVVLVSAPESGIIEQEVCACPQLRVVDTVKTALKASEETVTFNGEAVEQELTFADLGLESGARLCVIPASEFAACDLPWDWVSTPTEETPPPCRAARNAPQDDAGNKCSPCKMFYFTVVWILAPILNCALAWEMCEPGWLPDDQTLCILVWIAIGLCPAAHLSVVVVAIVADHRRCPQLSWCLVVAIPVTVASILVPNGG